ncbi:SH3 domain-containing protein [Loktanella sp. IMCC34160]|uniref:SH3 domain-containing protein n=1 Tax=Loktanella sp. IMCC34160 TaxID=2510646 RepID=UPI00101CCB6D|nr:SH3 domain-containing protein [Loktanella sp. IMCC34160]RYG92531.1 SH3 domain-containing protein [Loktanella sp. IMCC34160]
MPLTFVFMGWAFYEASGGAEFVPQERERVVATTAEPAAVSKSTLAPAVPEAQVVLASAMAPELTAPVVETSPAEALEAALALAMSSEDTVPPAPPTEVAEAETAATTLVFQSLAQPLIDTSAPALVAQTDLRAVSGSRVNMRSGPGTSYGVIVTLTRGTEAEVLETLNGWARIRTVEDGKVGWMAERLLVEIGA